MRNKVSSVLFAQLLLALAAAGVSTAGWASASVPSPGAIYAGGVSLGLGPDIGGHNDGNAPLLATTILSGLT